MSNRRALSMLDKYSQNAIDSGVESASPHRLIQMMMEGALDKIALAKGHMERREYEAQGRHINWAISLINGLRMSLNKEQGGDLAENLDALYDYMVRRLAEGHADGAPEPLDEVASLMRKIKSGWDAVPELLEQESRAETGEAPRGAAPVGI